MRLLKPLVWTIGCFLILLFGLEGLARLALGLRPLMFRVPYDPIFVSGDFTPAKSRSELMSGSNSPASYDYRSTVLGQYFWNGEVPPRSLTALSDFLFASYLSRYSSREVDHIICGKPDAVAIYVLGGSVAQGSSASSQQTTWHALLERSLRRNLQRNDIFVFNAAMGAFISTQERLAYHLAVSPRGAQFVLLVDGVNDLVTTASAATRPGDPHLTGTRFREYYGNPLLLWLAERSALVNAAIQTDVARSVTEYRRRLARDDGYFTRYANGVVDLYVENISAILKDCEVNGAICLVGIQPVRPLSAAQVGAHTDEDGILPPARIHELYRLLFEKIGASRYSRQFIDLTGILKAPREVEFFTDLMHLDDHGQELLAAALLPAVERAVSGSSNARRPHMIVACDRALSKTVATIDLARMSPANGGEVRVVGDEARLIADPRQWAYSATLTLGDEDGLSGPDRSIAVEFSKVEGEIGVGLATDVGATEFLSERSIASGSENAYVEFPLPAGVQRLALVFRKHASDRQRSEARIRRISIAQRP